MIESNQLHDSRSCIHVLTLNCGVPNFPFRFGYQCFVIKNITSIYVHTHTETHGNIAGLLNEWEVGADQQKGLSLLYSRNKELC